MTNTPDNTPSNEPSSSWGHFEATSFSKQEINALFSRMHKKNVEVNQSWDFASLKREAEIGFAESQYLLAESYRKGISVILSLKKACLYYQLAADQGHDEAQLQLGILFEEGLGVAQSKEQAFFYYQSAAEQNNPSALARLGICYQEGIGTEPSQERAIDCYRAAVEQDSIVGLYYLAKAYEEGNGVEKSAKQAFIYYKKRFDLVQSAADMGDVKAQILTAFCFEDGQGVTPSSELSIYYFTLAAENNDQYAQVHIGYCYETGKEVERCIEKAIYYYTLAADQGNLFAQFSLGFLLQKVNRERESLHYYMLAANNSPGFFKREAQYLVATCFENGRGTLQNVQKAVQYYQLAADAGCAKAQCRLGEAYSSGQLSFRKSYVKGVQYFLAAADNDNMEALWQLLRICMARSPENVKNFLRKKIPIFVSNIEHRNSELQVFLGDCYDAGIGVETSLEKAFYCYSLAAAQNNAIAQSHLGDCYREGRGVKQSLEQAMHYYQLVSEQGDRGAQIKLGECLHYFGRNEESFQHFMTLASQDKVSDISSKVLYTLAEYFENGVGIEKSEQSALHYYKQAADAGNTKAQLRLGQAYSSGELGLSPSLELGMHYYKLIEQRYPSVAQYYLGKVLYENKRYLEAFTYFKLAVEDSSELWLAHVAASQYYIGLMYKSGEGVEQSHARAHAYFQLAAENGYTGPTDVE
jgi:TPR repeat protein